MDRTSAAEKDEPYHWPKAGRQNDPDGHGEGASGQEGERTLFLNLDIDWDRPHFKSQEPASDVHDFKPCSGLHFFAIMTIA